MDHLIIHKRQTRPAYNPVATNDDDDLNGGCNNDGDKRSSSSMFALRCQGFVAGVFLTTFLFFQVMVIMTDNTSSSQGNIMMKLSTETNATIPKTNITNTTSSSSKQQQQQQEKYQHLVGNYEDGCTTLLSTFPNSGTTWAQSVFTSATGRYSEAIYREGPPTNFPGTYYHVVGNDKGHGKSDEDDAFQLPNQTIGECRFVKSHRRESMSPNNMPSKYQRAVVLYRDVQDNLEANLRYLALANTRHGILNNACNHNSKKNNPNNTDGGQDDDDVIDVIHLKEKDWYRYLQLKELHITSHTRFYCHAQQYPIPTLFMTYANLMTNPYNAFSEILVFIGYQKDTNITKAIEDNPPRHHHGKEQYDERATKGTAMEYPYISKEQCQGLDIQFEIMWNKTDDCVKQMADELHFKA